MTKVKQGNATAFLLVRKFPPRGLNMINRGKKRSQQTTDENKKFLQRSFIFTKMPSSSFGKHGWRLQEFHDDGRQCLLTDVLQTWVVFSFFVGLAHSYPERICQIRVILALNFWLSSEKAHVHQRGCDSGGHSSSGSSVIPSLGWSRYCSLHGCFSLDLPEAAEITLSSWDENALY